MTYAASAPGTPTSASTTGGASFVEWGAVFAGAVLAAAISFVLLTFGTAIGLYGRLALAELGPLRQDGRVPCHILGIGPADRRLHGRWLRRRPHAGALA